MEEHKLHFRNRCFREVCLSALSHPYVAFRIRREFTSGEEQKSFEIYKDNTALKNATGSRKTFPR